MRWRIGFFYLAIGVHAAAQDARAITVPESARKYLDILIKRPQPGTVFERFYASWLEEGTAEELGDYLANQTKNNTATAADHLLLAVYSMHRREDAAALAAYDVALKLDPGNAPAWIERSRLESRALDFSAALKSLDEAAKAESDKASAVKIGKLRGRALLRLGKNEEALKVWKELAATHAEDEVLAEELIDLLADEGQYEAAIEEGLALVKKSRDPLARTLRQLRLADVLLLAERRDDALKALQEALEATGQGSWIEGDVLSRMSRVFRMSDDVSGFEKHLAALAKEHPQRVALSWQHTQILAETGQKEEALKAARALLQTNPGQRDLQEGFLDLLESLEQIEDAVDQARALVRQNATDKELRIRLATLQHRAKDVTGAQDTLERFLALPGAGEADYLRVARLLENWEGPPDKTKTDGPPTPAAGAYARLVEKFPGSISAQEAQAHYLHRSGQREAALAIWQRLAASASLEDLLRIAQALQARLETRAALEVLMPRERDFTKEARFYALLVQLGIANKELTLALPWARSRLGLAKDAEAIESAIRDILIIVQSDEEGKAGAALLVELQGAATPTLQNRCLLSALFDDAGQSEEAEKILRDSPPEDKVVALSQLTQLFHSRQDWQKAAQVLQEVIDLPGARTSARVKRLVEFHRWMGKAEEALKWIAEWKKISPSAVQPWLDESRLLLELDRSKESLALLKDAMRKFPDAIEVASSYATLCLSHGQPDEAERVYLGLYERTTEASARLRLIGPLALAAQQGNGLARLIENFQQRQKQNRASAQPWLALAEIHRSTGNDEERRRCLYEASRLRPQDLELLHAIARSEEEVGLVAEALRTLDAAAKLDKTLKTREHIARLHIEQGDADTGYRLLFELAGGEQMDARAIEQMADTIAQTGEWERALTFLEPLLPKHAKDYRLHYLYAIALEEAGREKDAARAFIALMDLHEELPGVVNTGRMINLREKFKNKDLPPGAEDWLALPQMMQLAYMHRQKAAQSGRGGGYFGGLLAQQAGSGMPQGFIVHAPGVTESPVLALAHLLQIAGGWDARDRAALVPQLQQAGVREPELLLEAAEGSPQLLITPEMLLAHPQNLTLHAVWLMQPQQGDPEELLPLFENAWKLFQASDPARAQSIAQRAWMIAGETAGLWFGRVLEAVERQAQAGRDSFHIIASLLQTQHVTADEASQTAPRITPVDIRRLSDQLMIWFRAKPEDYHAGSLFGALVAAREWGSLAEALKITLNKPQPKTPASPLPVFHKGRHGGGGGQRLNPQPLYQLPGFPPEIANMAGNAARNAPIDPFTGESEEAVKELAKEMQEGLRPFLAQADEPRLKFILRLLCGEDAAIKTDLAVRLQAEDVTVEDFLTAAWIAQRANQSAEVVAHCQQALKLISDTNTRTMIESAMLHHAQRFIQGEQDETKSAPMRAQMKSLLEARLQTAVSVEEKYQIGQLMNSVGLVEEARAVEEAVQAAQNRGGAASQRINSLAANPYSQNRAYQMRRNQAQKTPEQLVKEGKTDLAVKESLRLVRAAIQQSLQPQNGASGHQQLHQVMDQAVKLKLWDEVAKTLRDTASGGWRSRLEYAVMLEHLGNNSEPALAEHRAVLAANARAYDSQVRLAVLLSYGGRYEEAVAHWRTVPAFLQEQHLHGIIQEFTQRHQYAVPQPQALSGLLCAWLKGMEPNRGLSAQLVQQFVQALQNLERADGSYPSLYQSWRLDPLSGSQQRWKLKADGTLDLDEANAKSRAARRQAHDELCRAMLAVPELAQDAFPPLAGLALADGDTKAQAEMEATALDLLTSLTLPKVKRRLALHGIHNYFNNGMIFQRQDRLFMPDAGLFLVRAAALRGDAQMLNDRIHPLISRLQDRQRLVFLKGYAELLMADEEGFVTAAEYWLKQQPSHAINNQGGAHDEVLRLWLERKINAPLDALYAPKAAAASSYQIPHATTAYVTALGQRNPEAMRQFVRKLRDQWLGTDPEARRKDIAAWIALQNDQRRRNGYYRQPGKKEQSVNAYIHWLQQLIQQQSGLPLLEVALEEGLDAAPGWLRQIAYQHSNSDRITTPDVFLQIAEEAGFLREAPRFRAYDMGEGGERPFTWLGNLARQFRDRSDEERINVTLQLLDKRPPTFGTHLLQALLVKNSRTPLWLEGVPGPFDAEQVARFSTDGDEGRAHRSAALETVLVRHAKDFPAMPEVAQNELALLLRGELSGYPQPERLGASLALILAPLLKTENADILRKADQVLAAKTWNEIGQQEYQFTEQFSLLLKEVARLDPAKAEAAARHAVELLRGSPEQKQSMARRNNTPPVNTFLHTLAQVPQLLSVIFELAEAEGLTRSLNWRSNLRNRLEQTAHHQDQAAALFSSSPFVAEAPEFRDLEDRDENEPTLLAHLINAIENNEKSAAEVREHLAKQPATFSTELLRAFFHREPGDATRSFYNSKRPADTALLAFIRKRGPEFEQLQPETAACLFALLSARLVNLKTQAAEDETLQNALQPLIKADQTQFDAKITRWTQTSDLRDSGEEPYEVIHEGVRLLDRLAPADKPRAVVLLDHFSKLLAQEDTRNNGGRPQPPHQTSVAQWLQRAITVPELFGEVRQRAEASGAAKDAQWLTEMLRTAAQISRLRSQPMRVIALLDEVGMLNPAATFDPGLLPGAQGGQPRSQLDLMLTDFRFHPGLAEALRQREPATFGVGLLLLFNSSSAETLTSFAQTHAAEIAACPPEQQRLLAQFIEGRKWTEYFAQNVPALQDEFAPLLKENAARSQAWLDSLLKTTTWRQIEDLYAQTLPPNRRQEFDSRMRASMGRPFYYPGQSYPAIDHLSEQLALMAAANADKALQGFRHVVKVYQAEFGRSGNVEHRHLLDPLLLKLCAYPRLSLAALQFAAQKRTSSSPSGGQMPVTENALIIQIFLPSTLTSVEKLAAKLADLGLLADAGDYDPLVLPSSSSRSMLNLVLGRLNNLTPEMAEKTAQHLLADKEAKFGHRLMAALLTAQDAPEKGPRLDLCAADFKRLTPGAAGALVSIFEKQFPELVAAGKAKGSVQRFAPLLELRDQEERQYLDALLAGRANLQQPFRGRTLVVKNELAALMKAGRRDEILKLLNQLPQFVEYSGRGDWVPRHQYYLNYFFPNILRVNDADSAALFACQMLAGAQIPSVRLISDQSHPQRSSIDLSTIYPLWEQRGGMAAPKAVFADFIREVSQHGIEGTRGLWLPILHDMLAKLGRAERLELAAWAGEPAEPALQIVGDEMRLAAALVEATSPVFDDLLGARRLVSNSSAETKAFNAAAKEAHELLRDETISPHVRLALAGYLCGVHPGLLDETTVQTWALAAAQAWHDDQPVTEFELEALLNAAAVSSVNETWKRISTLVLNHWKQREETFRQTNRRIIHRPYFPFVLRFACRSGDEGVLAAFYPAYARYDLGLVNGILMECGGEKAPRLDLRASLDAASLSGASRYGWLPPDETTLQAIRADSSEDALLAEVMALCADDDATWVLFPEKSDQPGYYERLAAFAKKLATTDLPKQVLQRAQTLVVLGKAHPAAALPLLSQFEAVEKVFFSDSSGGENSNSRQWAEFLAIHTALKLARNDFDGAEASFKRLQTEPKVANRSSSYLLIGGFYHETLVECLLRLWSHGLAREPAKLREFSGLKDPGNSSSGSRSMPPRTFQSLLTAWSLALELAPIPALIVEIDKLSDSVRIAHLVKCLAAIAGEGKQRLSFKQRFHLFENVFRQYLVTIHSPRICSRLIEHGFFTAEELVRNSDEIVRQAPVFPVAFSEELAAMLVHRGDLKSASALLASVTERWEAARQQSTSSYNVDRCLADRAAILIRLKDYAEARRCLDQITRVGTVPTIAAKRDALFKMLTAD